MISSSSTSSTSDFVLEINPTGAPRRQRTFDWLHCPELRWRRAYLELIISVCAYDFPIKAIANEASQGQLVRVERGCVAVRLALRGLEINAHAQTLQGSPPNYGGSSWLIARGLVLSDFQGCVTFLRLCGIFVWKKSSARWSTQIQLHRLLQIAWSHFWPLRSCFSVKMSKTC